MHEIAMECGICPRNIFFAWLRYLIVSPFAYRTAEAIHECRLQADNLHHHTTSVLSESSRLLEVGSQKRCTRSRWSVWWNLSNTNIFFAWRSLRTCSYKFAGPNCCIEQNETMKFSRVAFLFGSLQQASKANGVSSTLKVL
jgi:hypothetical protein